MTASTSARLIHEGGELGHLGAQLIGDGTPLLAGGLGIILNEGGADESGNDAPALAPGMRQDVAHEVHARQRCQVACKILATAALMPSWASKITSLTPRRPRRESLRKDPVQKVSASEGPISMPSTSRWPSPLTPTATITATETMRALSHLHVVGVDPQIGPIAFERPAQEGFDLLIDLIAQPADLALGDAAHAHGFDQIVDQTGRYLVHVGFLYHRRERLLGQAARLQEGWGVAALPQLGDSTVPACVFHSRSR